MKGLIFIFGFIMLSCGPISCLERDDFYFGFDGQIRYMKFKKDFGGRIIRKNHPQKNIYAGYDINENLSIEIGRESTVQKEKDSVIVTGQSVAGCRLPASLNPAIFKTKVKVRGPHIDLVFKRKTSEFSRLNLIGSIGISALTITCQKDLLSVGHPPLKDTVSRNMKKRSLAFRVMGGLQYYFDNGIALRGTLSFINTGRISVKLKGFDGIYKVNVPRVLPRDSVIVGIGIVVPM